MEQPAAQHPARGPVVAGRAKRGVAVGVLVQQRDGAGPIVG
jgi:hypothetical protein